MTDRTVSHPRINIEHPRQPAPSTASLNVVIDWLKGGYLASCPMTELELMELAVDALKAALVLRRHTA